MKKLAIVFCVGLLTAAVNANDIQFWFSTEANVQTAAGTGPLNQDITTAGPTTTRIYLYANTPGHWVSMYDPNQYEYFTGWAADNLWEGMALDLFFQGGGSLGADNKVLNTATPFGLTRWNDTSDFTWTPINAVATAERGIGGANNAFNGGSGGVFDTKQYCSAPQQVGQSGTLTSQVGWIAFTGNVGAQVYLAVGTQGVARREGDVNVDLIRFGVGDAALRGDAFGQHSTLYDARYVAVPEPASLLLLSLAGFALRRR